MVLKYVSHTGGSPEHISADLLSTTYVFLNHNALNTPMFARCVAHKRSILSVAVRRNYITFLFAFSCQGAPETLALTEAKPKGLVSDSCYFSCSFSAAKQLYSLLFYSNPSVICVVRGSNLVR